MSPVIYYSNGSLSQHNVLRAALGITRIRWSRLLGIMKNSCCQWCNRPSCVGVVRTSILGYLQQRSSLQTNQTVTKLTPAAETSYVPSQVPMLLLQKSGHMQKVFLQVRCIFRFLFFRKGKNISVQRKCNLGPSAAVRFDLGPLS
jgi:hypothetical protein